jgi:hypothetical protein
MFRDLIDRVRAVFALGRIAEGAPRAADPQCACRRVRCSYDHDVGCTWTAREGCGG